MRSNRPTAYAFALLAAFALPLLADSKPDTDESKPLKFQPLPVHEKALTHPDEFFARISDKVSKGTASSQEMRAWYELRKMYYPYTEEALPPRDWRAKALAKGRALEKPKKPFGVGAEAESSLVALPEAIGTLNWRHLGPTGFKAGDPPDASGVDIGTGRGTAIWVNPNDKNDIIAGYADGGVWITTNQGSTWTQVFDFQDSLSIGSIVAKVGASNQLDNTTTIWVATGEGNFGGGGVEGTGVYKSTDGGASWARQIVPFIAGQSPDRTSIRRIVIDPNNVNRLWIAADSGVFRTIDGGANWTLVTELPYYGRSGDCWFVYWTDIAIDGSTNPSTLYAAGPRPFTAGCSANAQQDHGIFRFQDTVAGTAIASLVNITQTAAACPTGRGYTCSGSGFATLPGNVGRITIVQAPSDKKHLYALLENKTNGQSLGIWETANAQNATVAWTARSTTNYCASQCWYDMTGAVHPTDPAKIMVGGLDAYISSNNAATLTKVSSWTGWGTSQYVHADHHHAIWVDATTYYMITDGGFYIGTVNAGATAVTWVDANGGFSAPGATPQNINTLQFYGLAQHPTQPYLIHGGMQDNGEAQSIVDGSGNITGWTQTAGGDGGFSATDQTSPNYAYEEYVYAIISRSTDSGSTYGTCIRNFGGCTTITTRCSGNCVPDNATEFIAPVQLDANNQAVLFTGSKFVYRNDAARTGNTWVQYGPDLSAGSTAGDDIVHIHSAKNNNVQGVLWAGTTNGRIWMTTGATSATVPTWTNVTKAPLPARSVTWITTDPTNGQRAIATFSGFNTGHVFRTTDGGTTWTDISGVLPNEPFNAAVIDPDTTNRPGRLYVGSDFGVYVIENVWTTSDLTTWTRINNGQLPHVKIHVLEFSNATLPNGIRPLRAATHGRGIWELEESACGTPPTISGFSPTSGIVGASVVITGTNFTGATSVKFNGISASFTVDSATQITATVPAGATSGKLTVSTSASCSTTSATNFTVIVAPTITSFSPGSGCAGTSVIITGTNLDSVTSVKFNGTSASFTINGPTQITATAPVGVTAGTISVTNPAGTATSSASFTVTSTAISSFSPASGPIGTNVTITGSGFTGATAVTFNGTSAITFTVNTDTEIVATVPSGASSGTISVTSVCGTATSASIFGVLTCDSAPTFAGATSATASACAIDVAWSAGTASCGTIGYNVYRSTASGFTPSASNRIATNVSATSWSDSANLVGGTTYYYIVRAVDSANGREDTNTTQRSATANASSSTTVTLFSGDFDNADTPSGHAWLVSRIDGDTKNQWVIASNLAHNGTRSGRFAETTTAYRNNQDERIFLGGDSTNTPGINGIAIPAGATSVTLSFWHWYEWDTGDSGRVEISLASNGGSAFTSPTTLATYSPGTTGGNWQQVNIDLTGYAGQTVWIGFRGTSNANNQLRGWHIDEVTITATTSGGICTATPSASNSFTARTTWDVSTLGNNKLEWVNPAASLNSLRVVKKAAGCPASSSDGTSIYTANTTSTGQRATYTDANNASGTSPCYAIFFYSGANQTGTESPARTVQTWVSNTLGSTAGKSPWIYATGASAMTPPAVTPGATGVGSIHALSNDRSMHALNTGATGGDWPQTPPMDWKPFAMNGPAQSRPSTLKLNTGYEIMGANRVSFVGSQDGYVYAVNANTGSLLWTSSAALGDMVQAAPSGYFRQYDAAASKPTKDIILIGSRTASGASKFYGIDAATGTILWTFDNGGTAMGVINAQATVDYADYAGKRRVYFTSRRKAGGSSHTVWALEFDHASATRLWSIDAGDIDSSPSLRNGLLYVGNNNGDVYALNASTGATSWGPVATGDGPVKTVLWIDAAASRIYFATTTKVWSMTLAGVTQWSRAFSAPTAVIRLGTRLYFGSGDGKLYELDNLLVTDANALTVKSVTVGPGTAAIGTPTYDSSNLMMYAGTEAGQIYPIVVPLP